MSIPDTLVDSGGFVLLGGGEVCDLLPLQPKTIARRPSRRPGSQAVRFGNAQVFARCRAGRIRGMGENLGAIPFWHELWMRDKFWLACEERQHNGAGPLSS